MTNTTKPLRVTGIFMIVSAMIGGLLIATADQPKAEETLAEVNDNESIDIRYARAHLELAKLDLRRALEWNKRVPHLFPAVTIEKLRRHVVIDEEQLKQCLMGQDSDLHEVCIRTAEAAVEIAEADLKRKRGVHERMPTTFSALNVERSRAAAKVARLNLERTRAQETAESVVAHLQWQIDELRNQVLELQLQLEMVASR